MFSRAGAFARALEDTPFPLGVWDMAIPRTAIQEII
jgi:hypothetical protein